MCVVNVCSDHYLLPQRTHVYCNNSLMVKSAIKRATKKGDQVDCNKEEKKEKKNNRKTTCSYS